MALVTFADVRGHTAQIEVLRRICASAQPAHAYLFEGPEGVGKQTVAWALAARLACLRAKGNGDACGRCRSCRALVRGEHADLGLLQKDGTGIKIDQVRSALKRLRFEPVLGRCKTLIVESADLLREEAANALLKTLEEPPPDTHFILLSSRPQRLLRTIISRCQALRFSQLAPEDVRSLLVDEGHPADVAAVAAALSEGSLARARPLCHADWLQAVDEVAQFTLSLDSRPVSDAAGFVEAFSSRWAELEKVGAPDETPDEPAPTSSVADARALARGLPPAVKKKRAAPARKGRGLDREGLVWAADVIRVVLRDALLVAGGLSAHDLPHARYAEALEHLADGAGCAGILGALQACDQLDERLTFNPNARLSLEALLVQAALSLSRR